MQLRLSIHVTAVEVCGRLSSRACLGLRCTGTCPALIMAGSVDPCASRSASTPVSGSRVHFVTGRGEPERGETIVFAPRLAAVNP